MKLKEALRTKTITEGMFIEIHYEHPNIAILPSSKTGMGDAQIIWYQDIPFILVLGQNQEPYALSTTSAMKVSLKGFVGWQYGFAAIDTMCQTFFGDKAQLITLEQFEFWNKKWSNYLKNGSDYWINFKDAKQLKSQIFYFLYFICNGEVGKKCLGDFNMVIGQATYEIRPVIPLSDELVWKRAEDKIIVFH